MSKVFIEETTLTGIADAIRGKNGTTALIATTDMANAITNLPTGGSNLPNELTLRASYINRNGEFEWLWSKYPSITIHTNGITESMQGGKLEDYSNMTILIGETGSSTMHYFFNMCGNIKKLPNVHFKSVCINNASSFFAYCERLKEIPEDFFMIKDENNESTGVLAFPTGSGNNYCRTGGLLNCCYSLRKHPILNDSQNRDAYNGQSYSAMFYNCWCMDEVTNIPVYNVRNYTSNQFSSTFGNLHRAKRITFPLTHGTYGSYTASNWARQQINLNGCVGYFSDSNANQFLSVCNTEITEADRVTDDASYQALKNTENWWTSDVRYSRYNHDSAVETINSLPNVTGNATGQNQIKFTGASGASTDGGAINTLTEAEIAVATAKGWTVSLS